MTEDKKVVQFEGVLDYYAAAGLCDVGPQIGGVDVIAELNKAFPWQEKRSVKVYLGVEPIMEGRFWAIHGFGGTDVTPPEVPMIEVGDESLFRRLYDLDGRHVLLIVEEA